MSSPTLRDTFLDEAKEFCDRSGMSLRQLGVAVMNDPSFFSRIQAGGGFTTRTFDRFREYFAAHDANASDADAA